MTNADVELTRMFAAEAKNLQVPKKITFPPKSSRILRKIIYRVRATEAEGAANCAPPKQDQST